MNASEALGQRATDDDEDEQGVTALMAAARANDKIGVTQLVQSGAAVTAQVGARVVRGCSSPVWRGDGLPDAGCMAGRGRIHCRAACSGAQCHAGEVTRSKILSHIAP